MALFSLLVAIIVERLKLLPESLQLDNGWRWYQQQFLAGDLLQSGAGVLLALALPGIVVAVLLWLVQGWLFGVLTLAIWTVVACGCFSHQRQRRIFKRYMQAACRGDAQACFLYAAELDSDSSLDAVSDAELGVKVGQMVVWLNYRYYAAVALFLVVFGPVGAIFYCTVRFFADECRQQQQAWPLLPTLLHWLDWLPARIVALGYVFSGQFSKGFGRWRQLALDVQCPARKVITEVALAAEELPEEQTPVCVRSTITLLTLSKRNFVLLLTILSLLTIFGVTH